MATKTETLTETETEEADAAEATAAPAAQPKAAPKPSKRPNPLDRSGSFSSFAIYNPDNADKLVTAYKEEIEKMKNEAKANEDADKKQREKAEKLKS